MNLMKVKSCCLLIFRAFRIWGSSAIDIVDESQTRMRKMSQGLLPLSSHLKCASCEMNFQVEFYELPNEG